MNNWWTRFKGDAALIALTIVALLIVVCICAEFFNGREGR